MEVKASCQAVVAFGRLNKVLLTWSKSPNFPEEHILMNVLKDRVSFERDKTYRITIEEEGP
jgi:hypothetical protein